jgi:hypothetical protein
MFGIDKRGEMTAIGKGLQLPEDEGGLPAVSRTMHGVDSPDRETPASNGSVEVREDRAHRFDCIQGIGSLRPSSSCWALR